MLHRPSVLALLLIAAALGAGCADSDSSPTHESAIERYAIPWVLEDDGRYALRAEIAIDAPAETVWAWVRDVNAYGSWSDSLTAHAESVAPGAPIDLAIQLLDPPAPKTKSREQILVVDDEVYAISWTRAFPFDQRSERWQLVVPEGSHTSRYYTALVFTQGLGSLMEVTLGPRTLAAFETFAAELAAEATGR